MSDLSDAVQAAADAMDGMRDRMVIEDELGNRYAITKVFAIGQKTDDPGVVVQIENRG